jgi:hypothetical protein
VAPETEASHANRRGAYPPEQFERFFLLALKDADFRRELERDGFGALERAGLKVKISPDVRAALARLPTQPTPAQARCGVCGVCGLCGLCGEVNLGSASAALWAIFGLAETQTR